MKQKALEKHDHVQHISQTPGMVTVNFFLDAWSYQVLNIHTRKGNRTSVKSFLVALLEGKPSSIMCANTLPSETGGKMTILTYTLIFVPLPTTKVVSVVCHPKG